MSHFGKLYLLPVPISDEQEQNYLPEYNIRVVQGLKKFIAEDAKIARRFLKRFGYKTLDEAEISLLNQHTEKNEIPGFLSFLKQGLDMGLMSDAGCPGIADPGAEVVKLAHQAGIEVVPLVGPSSIVLSIMASGFNGQNFAFIGYLPIEKGPKAKRIKELEQLALKHDQAQFFIETPYRNEQLFELLLEQLSPQSKLFIGKDICSPNQSLLAKTVAQWKTGIKPAMHKIPVVFGIYKE